MDNQKNTMNSRSKSTSSTPPRSSSMFDFHRAQNQYLPSSSGYFPYILPPWPMNYMYMDFVRQLSMDRDLRNGFPKGKPEDWEFGERERESNRSTRYHKRRNLRGRHRDRSASARSPYKPQFHQHLHGGHRHSRDGCWDRPLIETSSSSETLAPCNSCRCCQYFSESCSVLNIVGRAKCGRKYLNDQLFEQRCQGQHNCNHLRAAPSDVPVRERPASKKRRSGKRTPKKHETADESGADRRVKNKQDKAKKKVKHDKNKTEKDDSDSVSHDKSDSGSEAESVSRFCGGTGDERTVKSQTKMAAKKKLRPKSTAYFLPINYLNSNL